MKRILAVVLVCLTLLGSSAFAADREFSPLDYPVRIAGQHFVLYYTTKGADAATEAYAKEVLAAAEESYSNLVTKGGMRPPRVEPVPVVLMGDSPSLGGAVSHTNLGFSLWLQINPHMSKDFSIRNTVAHEFFHVIQAAYTRDDYAPGWGVEGTATVAPIYALANYKPDDAELGQLSEYFAGSDHPLKEEKYMVSLFWYWLADRYGGISFLHRLLTAAESVGWERAAQVAAIQGGAPDDVTFDSLWRTFALAMVNGNLPRGYQTNMWLNPTTIQWLGHSGAGLDDPALRRVDPMGRVYSYREPTVVQPYTFDLFEVRHDGTPLSLTVTGNPETVEAYLIAPGPNLAAALADYSKQPSYHKTAAPPTDPATMGARMTLGTPVGLQGARNSSTLVLILRTGTWGDGEYRVQVCPASGAGNPVWSPLAKVAGPGNSPGSPPPLTQAELAAVKAGTYLKAAQPVTADWEAPGNVLFGRAGSAEAVFNNQSVTLAVPVGGDGWADILLPARSIMPLFGGTVQGNRLTLGSKWAEVTPGSKEYRTARGLTIGWSKSVSQGGELMVGTEILQDLGCVFTAAQEFTLVCPVGTK